MGLALKVAPVALMLALCIAVEMLSARTRYSLRDRLLGSCFILLMPVTVYFLWPPLWRLWNTLGIEPLADLSSLNPALIVLLALVVGDLFAYWVHRFEHVFYWPVHVVHHSVRELHAASSYPHPLNKLTEFLFVLIPMNLCGLDDVRLPMTVVLIRTFQALIIHSPTNVHLGPLRYVFVDSRFHRIHHSLEPRHFDKNFGVMFSLWDQLFGTAYFPAKDEWPETGVEGVDEPRSVWAYLVMPFRRRQPVIELARLPLP